MTLGPNELEARLEAYLLRNSGQTDLQVRDLVQISDGWENEVYSFDLTARTSDKQSTPGYILRLYPGEYGPYTAEAEFVGLQTLGTMDHPVPRVYQLVQDPALLGKPFIIMELIDGELLYRSMYGGAHSDQQAYTTLFCGLMVQLHQLDWKPYTTDRSVDLPTYEFVDHFIISARRQCDRYSLDGFFPTIHWLENRRDTVPCERPGPIHWDFHPNNILLRNDGRAFVIDWTQLEVSDPRFDLAWTMILAASHIDPIWQDRVLSEYGRILGRSVINNEYFVVAGCLKRLGTIYLSFLLGPESMGMRPEARALMEAQLPAIQKVYAMLQGHTGLRVPEVEQLLRGDLREC
jgi:aminoglycoside phosphotransferase (APT) family kinase protein